MYLITIIWQEVNLFSQFSLATESSSASSTLCTYNPKRAHYDLKFLWHNGALWNSQPQMFTLGCVAHCSWCSQFVVAGITCFVTHTALWDNMCEHRGFPSKPGNLKTAWIQSLTHAAPAKCSELKNRKNSGAVCTTVPVSFIFSSFTIQRFTMNEKTRPIGILYMITFLRWDKNKGQFPLYLWSIFKCFPKTFQRD